MQKFPFVIANRLYSLQKKSSARSLASVEVLPAKVEEDISNLVIVSNN